MSATITNYTGKASSTAITPLTTLHGTVQTIVKTKSGITTVIDLTGSSSADGRSTGGTGRVLNLPTDVELPIGENVKITVTSTEPF